MRVYIRYAAAFSRLNMMPLSILERDIYHFFHAIAREITQYIVFSLYYFIERAIGARRERELHITREHDY